MVQIEKFRQQLTPLRDALIMLLGQTEDIVGVPRSVTPREKRKA